MRQTTSGIHHITAFVKDAQGNVDFYAGVLGLRLVKKTINFDAPEVYHLYFGNEIGSPGTAITFFPWKTSRSGRIGGGQVGFTTFAVPPQSLSFWEERLTKLKIPYKRTERFSEVYLQFQDSDGLQLEIVEREEGPMSEWSFGGVPADKAIKGFGGAILYSLAPEETMDTLENVLGLTRVGQDGDLVRFRAAGDLGNLVDINATLVERGAGGAGTVHHIAWRAKDHEDHQKWRNHVIQNDFEVTEIIDRQYFDAIYFREHGGILFEIATDDPGFAVDEPVELLGGKVMLPSWFEPHREELENNLDPIEVQVLEADK